MKLKHLESLLEDVEPFREPNVMLEQYPTGAHLAACVIHTAHARGDIEDCTVVDLGVGGGVLTIASLLMGAKRVVGVDVDPGAMDLATDNCQAFDPPLEPEFRMARIPKDILAWNKPVAAAAAEKGKNDPSGDEEEEEEEEEEEGDEDEDADAQVAANKRRRPDRPLRADTVVMNPPFGTRKKGADMGFLRAALGVAKRAVYSLHKTSTRREQVLMFHRPAARDLLYSTYSQRTRKFNSTRLNLTLNLNLR